MKTLGLLAASLAALSVPSTNILRIASATQHGETVTIGTTVLEIRTNGVAPTSNVHVDLSGGSTAAASKLLTFATNAAAADTVTIGGQVYTFRASLTASTTANEVLIGADLTETRDNLLAAINGGTGAGTLYGSLTTVNASVIATATSTDGLTATALIPGTVGNSIAIAEASTHLSWAGAATALSGGVDPTAAESLAALVAAIDGQVTGLNAQAISTTHILLIAADGGTGAIACTETLAGSNNGFAAATAGNGLAFTELQPIPFLYARSPTAMEVTLGKMHIPLKFTPRAFTATVRTSAGVAKAWDGACTFAAGVLTLDNTGSTDWDATDTVTVQAQG